jgi:hypothetical protein
MKDTYLIFNNKCGVCGCKEGVLTYDWAEYPDGMKGFAFSQGHTINQFRCCDCGAITVYECIPIISKIYYPEKVE